MSEFCFATESWIGQTVNHRAWAILSVETQKLFVFRSAVTPSGGGREIILFVLFFRFVNHLKLRSSYLLITCPVDYTGHSVVNLKNARVKFVEPKASQDANDGHSSDLNRYRFFFFFSN